MNKPSNCSVKPCSLTSPTYIHCLFLHAPFFITLSNTQPRVWKDEKAEHHSGWRSHDCKAMKCLISSPLSNTLIQVDCCRSTTLFAAFFICRWCSVEHSETSGLCLLDSSPGTFLPLSWSVPAFDCCFFLSLNKPASLLAWGDNYWEFFCVRLFCKSVGFFLCHSPVSFCSSCFYMHDRSRLSMWTIEPFS